MFQGILTGIINLLKNVGSFIMSFFESVLYGARCYIHVSMKDGTTGVLNIEPDDVIYVADKSKALQANIDHYIEITKNPNITGVISTEGVKYLEKTGPGILEPLLPFLLLAVSATVIIFAIKIIRRTAWGN